MKIVFLGTSKFSLIVLEKLIESEYSPVLVLTMPDKPVGRKQIITSPLIKQFALKNKIKTIQPINLKESISEIKKIKPDLGILASYGKIVPLEILNIAKHGFINIHPSLLPKYRGATPVQNTILNGDQETGVTIIKMTEKIDQGPIIAKEKIKINNKLTYQQLHNQLALLAGQLVVKTIPDWLEQKIKPVPQDETKASFTETFKKQDGRINWQNPAQLIERRIRAFYPWPGSYTVWKKNNNKQIKIKIQKAELLKNMEKNQYSVGQTLVSQENELIVKCSQGYLIINKLQMEGKKEMTSQEFLRGHQDFINTIFE
jgi:methionyl-tRNA formyltransferase